MPLTFVDEVLTLRRKYGLRVALRRRLQLWKNRHLSPSTERTVLRDLQRIGVKHGELVMVHSAFSKIGFLRGGPEAFISALKTAVGPTGGIIMPSFPHLGSTYEYAQSNQVLDVANTPTAVGRLQETFRKMPGVVRSLHPTHPYCAWGAPAIELLTGHHLSVRPFGPGTPLHRFIEVGGKALLVGVGLKNFTVLRTVEDAIDYPSPVYAPDPFVLRVRDYDGRELSVSTYVHSLELAPLRNAHVFFQPLKSRNKITEGTIGLATVLYVDCSGLLDILIELTNQGISPYSHIPAK